MRKIPRGGASITSTEATLPDRGSFGSIMRGSNPRPPLAAGGSASRASNRAMAGSASATA